VIGSVEKQDASLSEYLGLFRVRQTIRNRVIPFDQDPLGGIARLVL